MLKKIFYSFLTIMPLITHSQNIGIGTVNPKAKLEVNTTGVNDTTVHIRSLNPTCTAPALQVVHNGNGAAVRAISNNGYGIHATVNVGGFDVIPVFAENYTGGKAIYALSTGFGAALWGENMEEGFGVFARTRGNGSALYAQSGSVTGHAGRFEPGSVSNTGDVVWINSEGLGSGLSLTSLNQHATTAAANISSWGGRVQLQLEQKKAGEYSRIRMQNENIDNAFWDIASIPVANTPANSVMNFFFRSNATTGMNSMSLKGNGNLTILGTLTENSDMRLKKDLSSLTHSLEKIQQLNGYHYKWIDKHRDDRMQTGFVAQEVETVMPELVAEDEKGIKSVNYNRMLPYLVEAIKQQQQQIEELKKEIKQLKSSK